MSKQTVSKKISKKVKEIKVIDNDEIDEIESDEEVNNAVNNNNEENEENEENDDNDDENNDDEDKKKSKKLEYNSESFLESFEEIEQVFNLIETKLKYVKLVFKTAKKQYQKESKRTKKRKENNPDAPKKKTGFIKAKFVPDKFKSFYENHLKNDNSFVEKFPEFNINEDQPQTDITKIIYHYIRTNDLYDRNKDGTANKRAIKPDDQLTNLLLIDEGESIGFNNFQTYIKRLYNSNIVDSGVSGTDNEEEVVEVKSKSKKSEKPISSKSNA